MQNTKTLEDGIQVENFLLKYIEDEAQKLSSYDDFVINNYIDREALNLEMQNYLNNAYAEKAYYYIPTKLELSLLENIKMAGQPPALTGWFVHTKDKIRKTVCHITGQAAGNGSFNWKITIKNILENLSSELGSNLELTAIITPVIIGFIAKLIKNGHSEVCAA